MEKLIKNENGQWNIVDEIFSIEEAKKHLAKGDVIQLPVRSKPTRMSGDPEGEVKEFPISSAAQRNLGNLRINKEVAEEEARQQAGGPEAPRIQNDVDDYEGYSHHGLDPAHEKSIISSLKHPSVHDVQIHPEEDGSHTISILHDKTSIDKKGQPVGTENDFRNMMMQHLQGAVGNHGELVSHQMTNLPGNRKLSKINVQLSPFEKKKLSYKDFF